MLLPQYTVRRLLAITTACALVFAVFGLAARGQQWAIAVSVAVAAGAAAFVVFAAVFGVVWGLGLLLEAIGGGPMGSGASPFMPGVTPLSPEEPSTPVSDKDIPAAPILLE
jgi:hypothetical protein